MSIIKYILTFFIIASIYSVNAQEASFSVNPATFSSNANDEFGPVFYKGGVIFCSNASGGSAVAIKSGDHKLFDIVFAPLKDSANWKNAEIFSKELTTIFNEGPATFNREGTIIYYARNTIIEGKLKKINDPSNKLGIFSAEFVDGEWKNLVAFPYNNIKYSMGTPSLTADGTRLYFASDRPGGFGGNDIYYSDFKGGVWQEPVNLGEGINTSSNESYPFACESGRLFFTSDHPSGFGGKDIYFTYFDEGQWVSPIHLDKEINSEFDDYGLVTDKNFQFGFFSTNRGGTADIFHFDTDLPQFTFCKPQQENKRCFEFYDERYVDTLYLEYVWDFGDGVTKSGFKVEHCFNRGGHHEVNLTVLHKVADTIIRIPTSYSFDLEDIEQPYIDVPEVWAKNTAFEYNSHQTNLPKENVQEFIWNFGDGFKTKQQEGSFAFSSPGEYDIELGVYGRMIADASLNKSCVSKRIRIVDDMQAAASHSKPLNEQLPAVALNARENLILSGKSYLLGNFTEEQKYEIVPILQNLQSIDLNVTGGILNSETQSFVDNLLAYLASDEEAKLIIAFHTNENRGARKNIETTNLWKNYFQRYLSQNAIALNSIEILGYGNSRTRLLKKEKNAKEFYRWADVIVYK